MSSAELAADHGFRLSLIALAASAGGLRALSIVLAALPAALPAAVVVVQHIDPHHRSLLAPILGRRTALRVKEAEEGETLAPGVVSIAPPDSHLLVQPAGILHLSREARVHFVRPAADRLFASAAASYGECLIAVVLTGAGSDGADGVRAVKQAGGTVIVQSVATAEYTGMPSAAVDTHLTDYVVPLGEIGPLLISLVGTGART